MWINTASGLNVLQAIGSFLLNLPGSYRVSRVDTNAVGVRVDKKAKNENSKPMARVQIYNFYFIRNILVPFFDKLT